MRDVSQMTTEQKIGQLICVRTFETEEEKEFLFDMLKKGAVGGIQVRNFEGRDEFIKRVKETADYPVLICADMEHGFPGSELNVPHTMSVSATGSTEYAYELARTVAVEAKAAGYNVVWGPVVDFAASDALCRNTRCFGDDPELVSDYGLAMIRGYQDEGMIVAAKHFLNPPDICDDTHIKEGWSNLSEEELINKVAAPYVRAIKEAELSGIMTAHNILKNVDDRYIASLSEKATGIIRKLGFKGLVFTDSLSMMGITRKYGIKESMGLSIKAGNDIILHNMSLNFKETFECLMEQYENGVFSEERLNDAVSHVTEAQEKSLKPASQTVLSDKQINDVKDLSKLSLCLRKQNGVKTKLDNGTGKLFVLLCENPYAFSDKIGELQTVHNYERENVELKKLMLEKEFPGSEVVILNEFPHKAEIRDLCVKITDSDETIFFTFNHTTSYQANDDINDRIKYLIKSYSNKISTVIHMGNPYVLKNFENIKRVFWGTTGGTCEDWAIKAMKGEFEPTGKVPVSL